MQMWGSYVTYLSSPKRHQITAKFKATILLILLWITVLVSRKQTHPWLQKAQISKLMKTGTYNVKKWLTAFKNPLTNNPGFKWPCGKGLFQKHCGGGKLLKTSIFSISHNVIYSIKEENIFFLVTFSLSSANSFNMDKSIILFFGSELSFKHRNHVSPTSNLLSAIA